MRFFIDTEFIEDGPKVPLELISLAIVPDHLGAGPEFPWGGDDPVRFLVRGYVDRESQRSFPAFYAENSEADLSRASWWVQKNVLTRLDGGGVAQPRRVIAAGAMDFVNSFESKPEFWGYFADYDWVIFCQLFGRMIDLPKGWPMYCNDLVQLLNMRSVPRDVQPKQPKESEHNALADAIWNRKLYRFAMDWPPLKVDGP